jgi:hypothetical protein
MASEGVRGSWSRACHNGSALPVLRSKFVDILPPAAAGLYANQTAGVSFKLVGWSSHTVTGSNGHSRPATPKCPISSFWRQLNTRFALTSKLRAIFATQRPG